MLVHKTGKRMYFASFIVLLIFTLYTGTCATAKPYVYEDFTDMLISKIEQPVYAKNYVDYEVYWRKNNNAPYCIYQDMNSPYILLEGSKIYQTEIMQLVFNREEIFPFYDTQIGCTAYSNMERLFDSIADGTVSLHDMLKQRGSNSHAALARVIGSHGYEWLEINVMESKKRLITSFSGYPDAPKLNFETILSNGVVMKQLQENNLDLENTKMLVLKDFFIFHGVPGILFYDESNEYYMPFNTRGYAKNPGLAQYLLPEELPDKTISAFQLYDVRKELMPYLSIQTKALKRLSQIPELSDYSDYPEGFLLN